MEAEKKQIRRDIELHKGYVVNCANRLVLDGYKECTRKELEGHLKALRELMLRAGGL
jgi:hypothetical protein